MTVASLSQNGVTPEGVPALEIADLRFDYPDGTPSLRGLSLRADPGEKIALIGPNGAGKAQQLLHPNGILPSQSGSERGVDETLADGTARPIRERHGIPIS